MYNPLTDEAYWVTPEDAQLILNSGGNGGKINTRWIDNSGGGAGYNPPQPSLGFSQAIPPIPDIVPGLIPGTSSYPVVSSSDPNDISGPQGVGVAKLINDTTPLSYQIRFENLPTATAPAQTVVITDQLDPTKVNLSTFSLGPIGFGSEILTPLAASSSYSAVVDLQPANDLLVEVDAALNLSTGLVTWTFTSLDPSTGQPTTNPLAGFLPPDVTPPEGDGSVTFFVQPNSGLTTGTQIADSATIVFDNNAPLSTSQWVNTIANGPILNNGTTSVADWIQFAPGVTADSGLSVFDPTSATLSSATISITSGLLTGDLLNFTNQNGISGTYDATTGVLTLSGVSSLANYQAALHFDHLQLHQSHAGRRRRFDPHHILVGERRH